MYFQVMNMLVSSLILRIYPLGEGTRFDKNLERLICGDRSHVYTLHVHFANGDLKLPVSFADRLLKQPRILTFRVKTCLALKLYLYPLHSRLEHLHNP